MPTAPDNPPLIIAHRGDSHNAPENTLAAFRLALEKGADGVEFDVQLARDGGPVVIHDFNLKRTAGRGGRISDMTSEDLAALGAGSWFNRKFPALARPEYERENIPTLEQTLHAVRTCSRIYVELKCEEGGDYSALATATAEVLRGFGNLDRIVVKSFNLATLPIVKSLLPDVATAALFAPTVMHFLRKKEYLINVAREAAADELSLHTSLATKHITQIAANAEMPVTIWTTDDPAWLQKARDRSIRAIITNDPAAMLAGK
jgi:glycerophosphoryl diester phosphodiesterase